MDIATLLETFGDLFSEHWPFAVISLSIGLAVQIVKLNFLTRKIASRSKPAYVLRAFLPLFGACAGLGSGLAVLLFVDPAAAAFAAGINTSSKVVLYFTGAGLASTFAVTAIKHFARRRGIESPFGLKEPPS